MGWFLFFCAVVVIFFLYLKYKKLQSVTDKYKTEIEKTRKEEADDYEKELALLKMRLNVLDKYKVIVDVEEHAKFIQKNPLI